MTRHRLALLSDVHYAGARERARGEDFEYRDLENVALRLLLQRYRRHVWLHHPLQQNGQLERFLTEVPAVDFAIANGDYSCDTGATGLSDDAALESAAECLGKLRQKFHDRLRLNYGDHELGKLRLLGAGGGMRLRSWERAQQDLQMPPLWRFELGRYVLFNCVSSLIALPVFQADTLPEERAEWARLRAAHLAGVRAAFAGLQPGQRVLFFCHDPTALPFLWREAVIREKLPHVERTIIGHLHSNFYLRLSRLLSGLPALNGLGHSVRRYSRALREARLWRPFRVLLCPSLAGIELLKDGGYFTVELATAATAPARFQFHPLRR
ncbi:MAG TPA: hypothetical protein PKN95_01160 [Verrucomicrobiota bacterium]|nr:hypothetical protein [Verrucomicrobiota bacterium]HNT13745.1 hypothetical protein [Verrucomicrobiota bacterium]